MLFKSYHVLMIKNLEIYFIIFHAYFAIGFCVSCGGTGINEMLRLSKKVLNCSFLNTSSP